MKNLYFIVYFLINFFYSITCLQTPDGALVFVHFKGIVGFNLDEIPSYLMNESLNFILNYVDDSMWEQRAIIQISATTNFKVFGSERQLTIPPKELWKIEMNDKPFQTLIGNHSFVVRKYQFNSVLVGPASNLNASEPLLTEVGGKHNQKFILPIDPEHLLQRTGFACTHKSPTINSENILSNFNQNSPICVQALKDNVGLTVVNIKWERITWDENVAKMYRFGDISQFADLQGDLSKLKDEINIGYRFIEENSCVLDEGGSGVAAGCARDKGWRQLLKFSSVTVNIGRTEIHLGNISAEYVQRGIFEFDPCHKVTHKFISIIYISMPTFFII